jgi:hypothetical protein
MMIEGLSPRDFAGFFLMALVCSAFAGCATPAEMRTRPPEFELKSNFPAKTVSICIADGWESAGPLGGSVPVNMRPIEGGYTVSWRNGVWGHTGMLVDVKDTLNGSLTRYFKNMVIGEGAFDKIVVDCQNPTRSHNPGEIDGVR